MQILHLLVFRICLALAFILVSFSCFVRIRKLQRAIVKGAYYIHDDRSRQESLFSVLSWLTLAAAVTIFLFAWQTPFVSAQKRILLLAFPFVSIMTRLGVWCNQSSLLSSDWGFVRFFLHFAVATNVLAACILFDTSFDFGDSF